MLRGEFQSPFVFGKKWRGQPDVKKPAPDEDEFIKAFKNKRLDLVPHLPLRPPPGVRTESVVIGLLSAIIASQLPYYEQANLMAEIGIYLGSSVAINLLLASTYHTFVGVHLRRPSPSVVNMVEGWVAGTIGVAIDKFILPESSQMIGRVAGYILPSAVMYLARWRNR